MLEEVGPASTQARQSHREFFMRLTIFILDLFSAVGRGEGVPTDQGF